MHIWVQGEIYTSQLLVPTLSAPPVDVLVMRETSCPLSDFSQARWLQCLEKAAQCNFSHILRDAN